MDMCAAQSANAALTPPGAQQTSTFSAAQWHRQRRREILEAHPEVRSLTAESDVWVASLGVLIIPCFVAVLAHTPEMSIPELCFHVVGIGSLRANWAVYCGHAISHGRWRAVAGSFGTVRFNSILAAVNVFHAFQILPSYWVMHHSHHTRLGTLPLVEARDRAKRGRQTDGDLGIATRGFSPPARKYRLILDRTGVELPRQNEAVHQVLSVVVHAIAPIAFTGYAVAALRTDSDADPAVRRSLVVQASASLLGYLAVASLSFAEGSWAPLLFYLTSSAVWLSPLNPNWIWTCPHVCQRSDMRDQIDKVGAANQRTESAGTLQPTVSFYTPSNVLGVLLDMYMGFENYHCEHHDFPEMPMYHLPKLRAIAPEYYDGLRALPVTEAETWAELMAGDFFYACQDETLAQPGRKALDPTA